MSEFKREERYAVIKFSHLTDSQKAVLASLGNEFEIPSVEAVVVEADWPEYETVWRMIERRVTGSPSTSRLEMKHVMQALDQVRGRPVLTSNQCHDLAMLLNDYLPIEDSSQSELAALREELAACESQKSSWVQRAKTLGSQADDLAGRLTNTEQRLADAERRNATLTKAISDAEYRADQGKVWNGMGWTYTGLHSHGQQKVIDILRAALKPTESGASE